MYLDALSVRRRNSLFISSSMEVASSTLSFLARNCSTISECSFSNSSINKASSKAPSPFASQTSPSIDFHYLYFIIIILLMQAAS